MWGLGWGHTDTRSLRGGEYVVCQLGQGKGGAGGALVRRHPRLRPSVMHSKGH